MKSAYTTEIADFLLQVAAGNTEPDTLAREAAELLETSGQPMTEIAHGQWQPQAAEARIERTWDGYNRLCTEALQTSVGDGQHYTPTQCVESARTNAYDTCRENGGHTDWSEWLNFFFATLESVLTYSEVSNEVKAWFAARGIRG